MMHSVLSIDTVRIEVLGEARAVTATGGQWVDFREQAMKAKKMQDEFAGMLEAFRAEVHVSLDQLDGLADVWGDEGVFRRCRDRLRHALKQTEGGAA